MRRTCKILGLLFLCLLYISGCGNDFISGIFGSAKQGSHEDPGNPDSLKIIQDADTELSDKSANSNKKDNIPESDVPASQIPKKNILIALDPGHQGPNIDMSAQEPIAPGSEVLKTKATGGTNGTFSGVPEYQLNLDIAQMVYERLTAYGYDVILTRENNDTAISNAERAMLANEAGADISVRIHANGSEDPNANGALVLIGSAENPYTAGFYESSYQLGEKVLNAYCNATGMQNLGIQFNDSMTGINWSQIPVIILEMGFMTNQQDDLNMANEAYRQKMANGIVSGIHAYYGFYLEDLSQQIQTTIAPFQASGSEVSVYAEQLSTGAYASLDSRPMQAASLIKLYIAGCIYEHLGALQEQETYPGETEELLAAMITISDNDAANTLVNRLGSGDSQAGMALVNQFCQTHHFTDTHMGRMLLATNDTDDNYTSVADCGKFLRAIYQKQLTGADSILNLMKQQERTEKIPAGVPADVVTANKTGELYDVENDAAIIFDEETPYIICIMMSGLSDTYNARATITSLSSQIYQYMHP